MDATHGHAAPSQACLKDGSQGGRLVLAIKLHNPLAGAPGVLAALVAAEQGAPAAPGSSTQAPVPGLALDKVRLEKNMCVCVSHTHLCLSVFVCA